MNQILKDLLKTAKEQLFPVRETLPRTGKLVPTVKAVNKMKEWYIDEQTLRLTYQVGEKKFRKDVGFWEITRKYQKYSVGFWYVEEYQPKKGTSEVEKIVRVITCWKGGVRI
jgi:hypothetical protein